MNTTVLDIIRERGIQEVLHFTTNRGLTGILDSRVVKPRQALPQAKRLEHIVVYNCPDRSRDRQWHGYVNLSISSVNMRLFNISKGKWHFGQDNWWCILSFVPEIITHSGVVFTTTNNAYTRAKRAEGPVGLQSMFLEEIEREPGWLAKRTVSIPLNQPTCNQAEVLYPGDLSIDYLEHVYVENGNEADSVKSILSVFDLEKSIDCLVRPELFP